MCIFYIIIYLMHKDILSPSNLSNSHEGITLDGSEFISLLKLRVFCLSMSCDISMIFRCQSWSGLVQKDILTIYFKRIMTCLLSFFKLLKSAFHLIEKQNFFCFEKKDQTGIEPVTPGPAIPCSTTELLVLTEENVPTINLCKLLLLLAMFLLICSIFLKFHIDELSKFIKMLNKW